ncbi:hypothetical protein C483_16708 [Natrialba hulunbeirensis JCM 10989]|uniref:Methyltransferase type 11 domain-containing protein n=1 Tax=Natrialba hulunbeirensis JCM 10989 TaxID=1227493 RepID=L9ZMI8_9EURY|nr:class I SAM-dependent methyltransferase [Natrialba hulunbeirensis]ELY87559.1 hypothetical protein C483_16708 [Natrialba hulunbeirensis JCM 10989]
MSDSTDALEETQAFYDEYGTDEWDRLATGIDGELEFGETLDTLASALPSSGRVLDAGGGAGRYSQWLAARGHDVTLLDLSRGQLSVAVDRLNDADTDGDSDGGVDADSASADTVSTVSPVQGSITDLGLPANAFDAVCCLGGPLSHLLDEADRVQAVRELRRVAKPNAPVVVSVMGLLGAVQLYLLTGHNVAALPELLEHGDYDSALLDRHGYENEFTATHFFRRDELESLLATAGIDIETVRGLEGLASPFHADHIQQVGGELTDDERQALERVVTRTNDDPIVADLSIHMLAVGRA